MTEVLAASNGLQDRFNGMSVSGHQAEGNHGQTSTKSSKSGQQRSVAAASSPALSTQTHTNPDASAASPEGASPRGKSSPLAIPAAGRNASSPPNFEKVSPQLYGSHNSTGEPAYRGRLSRRKNSYDSFNTGSPVELMGSYSGRLGSTKDNNGEAPITGCPMGSTGDVQRMFTPSSVYHGAHGDTTGSSPPGPGFEAPNIPLPSGAGRLSGNILQRESAREDPFGPSQEYHGPLA